MKDMWYEVRRAEACVYSSPSPVTDRNGGNAGRAGLGWGGGCLRGNVYAASSDCVVVSALGSLEAFCEGLERSTQLFIIKIHAHTHTHTHTLT